MWELGCLEAHVQIYAGRHRFFMSLNDSVLRSGGDPLIVYRAVVGGVTRRNLRNSVGVLKLVAAVVHCDVPLRNSRYSAIWEAFWARSLRPMDCDRGRSEVMTPGKVHDV